MYSVKEIFYSIQGEGFHSGTPVVFCRLSGCNLWNGKESDRSSAICKFCDTDFLGTDGTHGGKYNSANKLAKSIEACCPSGFLSMDKKTVVFTGGEPLLQLDKNLVDAMHRAGFFVAIETNGTILPPGNVDWICVSPKAGANLVVDFGDELKLVYPQQNCDPSMFEEMHFDHFYLQPMDGPRLRQNMQEALSYCLRNPKWKVSIQTHKVIGAR
jgi:7-carboxy-7-deazaguanine synthase (Cx14CxxC type)